MRSQQRVIMGTLIVLVLLAGIAVENELTERYQVLPFSSWSLFSRVPEREKTDYGLRFTTIDGVAQDPPVYFESAGFVDSDAPTAYELTQDVGKYVARYEPLRAEAAWTTFTGRYLGEISSAEVEVVERTYDILDRRSCDCFDTETVVGTLEMGS